MGRNWCRHCKIKGVCKHVRKGIFRRSSCDTCLIKAGIHPSEPRIVMCSVCFGTAIITDERLKQLTDEYDQGNDPNFLGEKIEKLRDPDEHTTLKLAEGQDKRHKLTTD